MLNVNRQISRPDAQPSQGASRASVLPRPTLVGLSAKPASQPKPAVDAKSGPEPKREPTLRGVVPKGAPVGLAPLAEAKPAPKKKSESSLIGLSLKVERSRIVRNSPIESPAAPPGVRRSSVNLRSQRHAAEPTDHNVEIVDPHAPTVDMSHRDDLWEQVAADQAQRGKRRAILTAVALLSMLAVFAIAPRLPTRGWASAGEEAKLNVPQPRAEIPPAIEVQPEDALEAVVAPAAAPALEADMLASAPAEPQAKVKASGHSKHRRSHAHRRAHKRKVTRSHSGSSSRSTASLR